MLPPFPYNSAIREAMKKYDQGYQKRGGGQLKKIIFLPYKITKKSENISEGLLGVVQ